LSATSPPAIEVRDLEKEFHDRSRGVVRAVDRVTFSCHPGRIFGLLGPNGAGKTTTLRILSTAIRPTGGSGRLGGYDVVQDPERVRESIGFLSGATGLYERSTAREVLGFFGSLYGLAADTLERRIRELAGLFQMEPFLDRACGKLSAGQRQKVSIARTIVHDPPILILDEPTSSLDVLVAREVVLFIDAERKRGKTVLLSTHIMSEVDRLCDDVAIIHEGRLLASGTQEEVRAIGGGDSVEDTFFRLIPVGGGREAGP
jgi:sodium transport system ATP-binding protein